MPSWPRSWANFSPLSLYSHRNAWANLHLLGQPNTFLARVSWGAGACHHCILGLDTVPPPNPAPAPLAAQMVVVLPRPGGALGVGSAGGEAAGEAAGGGKSKRKRIVVEELDKTPAKK